MQLDMVTGAVRTLRERGERVSVRSVHSLLGGSFRDLSKLLRDTNIYLADDEVEDLDTNVSETPTPAPVEQVAAMFEAARVSERLAGEASAVLDETRQRLHVLLAPQILPATDPHDVAGVVAARRERANQVAQLQDEITQLEKLVEQHMTDARSQRFQGQELEARARELQSSLIPSRKRDLADARRLVVTREAELTHHVRLAQRHVEAAGSALTAAEVELRRLTRDPVP